MKLPTILSKEDFEKLFQAEKNKKFKLAYLLGFESGLRISEIVGYKDKIPELDKENINLQQNSIKILGKGGKERIVPLPKRFNKNALDLLPLHVPRRTLQDAVTRLSKRVLGKPIHFHTLRHGFGSYLADRGMPLHEIQMLMGHSRLDTTGIYLHANPQKSINEAREIF